MQDGINAARITVCDDVFLTDFFTDLGDVSVSPDVRNLKWLSGKHSNYSQSPYGNSV